MKHGQTEQVVLNYGSSFHIHCSMSIVLLGTKLFDLRRPKNLNFVIRPILEAYHAEFYGPPCLCGRHLSTHIVYGHLACVKATQAADCPWVTLLMWTAHNRFFYCCHLVCVEDTMVN